MKEICLQGDTIQAQKIQSDKACKLRKLECISSPKFKKTDCKLKQKNFKNLLDYFDRLAKMDTQQGIRIQIETGLVNTKWTCQGRLRIGYNRTKTNSRPF